MHELMNQCSDGGDCRTASARPGLLKSLTLMFCAREIWVLAFIWDFEYECGGKVDWSVFRCKSGEYLS